MVGAMLIKSLNIFAGLFGYKLHKLERGPRNVPNANAAKPVNENRLSFEEIYNLRTSMDEMLDHCKTIGLNPEVVIDVGVAYGTMPLYTRFPQKKHFLIEPIKEYEPSLQNICDHYNAEYVLAAASAEKGSTSIYVGNSLDGSSIMVPTDNVKMEKRRIPLITLDECCEERQLDGPYLLKVDVQGAELMVLDGAARVLNNCDLVILEVSLFNFRPEMPDIYDVISYMKNKGFVVYDFYGGHNRPLDGARAQIDIVFVKENGIFRTSHKWTS